MFVNSYLQGPDMCEKTCQEDNDMFPELAHGKICG